MQPNPFLRKLGFSDTDRVVVIHADDIGLCHASVAAMEGLMGAGIVSSMSAMAAAPWFPAAAAFCRSHPEIDMGLHFTLTSESEVSRSRPFSTRDPASGLVDGSGFFHQKAEILYARGKPASVLAELKAQMDYAQASGIDLTHVDSHCLTAWAPKFLPAYLQEPARRGLPSLFLRAERLDGKAAGAEVKKAEAYGRWTGILESRGWPVFDRFEMMPLDRADDRIGEARRKLSGLPPGLTYFVIHPAADTPELRAFTGDWKCRVADYRAFTSSSLRGFLKRSGLRVVGWRALRDAVRKK
ncbi:MAG: ChbG/HpnK family deacetylase [Anaerolineales bacterium]|nr:ChbG/HpnK family deacetylase [Anaerolineales bacterium]